MSKVVHVGGAVLVTGETFAAKAPPGSAAAGSAGAGRPQGGGRRGLVQAAERVRHGRHSPGLTQRGSWVFEESKRAAVLAALENAPVEVAEGQAAKPEPAPPPEPSVNAEAHLTIENYKKSVVVKGDTKSVKEQLKGLRGSWNNTLGGWIFPGSRKDEVAEFLRRDPTVIVEFVEGQMEPPAKRAKKERHDDFIDDDDE